MGSAKVMHLVLISLGLLSTDSYGRSLVVDSTSLSGTPIGLYMDLYEDHSHSLTIRQIQSRYIKGSFTESSQEVPLYGFRPHTQWARFSLTNPNSEPIEVFLENQFTLTDNSTLYYQRGVNWQSLSAGDQVDFSTRDLNSRQIVYRLS